VATTVAVEHRSTYAFDRPVRCSPHELRLRPAAWSPAPVVDYQLTVEPEATRLRWWSTPEGAWVGRLVVPDRVRGLILTIRYTTDVGAVDPLAPPAPGDRRRAAGRPAAGRPATGRRADRALLDASAGGPAVAELVADLEGGPVPGAATVDPARPERGEGAPPDRAGPGSSGDGGRAERAGTLARALAVADRVAAAVAHAEDHGPGPVAPAEVLAHGRGSCRDSAWVLVQACRAVGLPARFVTGHLLRVAGQADLVPGAWPAALPPEGDALDLHAWAEVRTPGGAWLGVDPTTARPAGGGHVPLAAATDPPGTTPVRGTTEPCAVTLEVVHRLLRRP
jgi:transglutaminase-like putative cysteine protease